MVHIATIVSNGNEKRCTSHQTPHSCSTFPRLLIRWRDRRGPILFPNFPSSSVSLEHRRCGRLVQTNWVRGMGDLFPPQKRVHQLRSFSCVRKMKRGEDTWFCPRIEIPTTTGGWCIHSQHSTRFPEKQTLLPRQPRQIIGFLRKASHGVIQARFQGRTMSSIQFMVNGFGERDEWS